LLKISTREFYVQKYVNEPADYEDAFGHNRNCMAIADGATDSVGSGLWARILAQTFIQQPPIPTREAMLQWLESLAQLWNAEMPWDRVPWYAINKAKRGPISTLLGVTFDWSELHPETATAAFEAVAVGDSCLFQIRQDELITCFPLTRSVDFGTRPPLLSTRVEDNRPVLSSNFRQYKGSCKLGDLFILATDAFSGWFVRRIEKGERPWQDLIGLTGPQFLVLVEQLRQKHLMRDDDVTVLLGHLEHADPESCPQA